MTLKLELQFNARKIILTIGKSEAEVCHIRLARREKRKLQQEAADADRENEGT